MTKPVSWLGSALNLKETWLELLGTGILVITLSWAISGCRWGNRVEGGGNPDPYSGYYEMAPQSVKFCMGRTTTPSEVCVDANANQIPPYLSKRLTNPVAFIMQDQTTGSAAMVNNSLDMSLYLPISIDSNQKLSLLGNFSPGPIVTGSDPNCSSTIYVDAQGSLSHGGTFTTQTGKAISGRITLDAQVVTTFGDACSGALGTLAQCYNSPANCGALSLTDVQNFLNPYLNANLLTLTDVPNLTSLSYEVVYQ